jgi:hypothetical protein
MPPPKHNLSVNYLRPLVGGRYCNIQHNLVNTYAFHCRQPCHEYRVLLEKSSCFKRAEKRLTQSVRPKGPDEVLLLRPDLNDCNSGCNLRSNSGKCTGLKFGKCMELLFPAISKLAIILFGKMKHSALVIPSA